MSYKLLSGYKHLTTRFISSFQFCHRFHLSTHFPHFPLDSSGAGIFPTWPISSWNVQNFQPTCCCYCISVRCTWKIHLISPTYAASSSHCLVQCDIFEVAGIHSTVQHRRIHLTGAPPLQLASPPVQLCEHLVSTAPALAPTQFVLPTAL